MIRKNFTFVAEDNIFGFNSEFYQFDNVDVDDNIRAIQFDFEKSIGHIEYFNGTQNLDIYNFSEFEHLFDKWTIFKKISEKPSGWHIWNSDINEYEIDYVLKEKLELEDLLFRKKAFLDKTDHKFYSRYKPKENENLDEIELQRDEAREFIRQNETV